MIQQNEFIQWIEKEVKIRWPKHNFSFIEIGDWHWRLRDFDVDTLTQAVRQHKAIDDWRTPSLKKVYDYAKKIHTTNHPKQHNKDKRNTGVPEAHVYIMCTGKDERGKGNVGWFLPILIWPFGKTYTADQYHRNAEAFAQKHADFYGGVWEVVAQTNQLQMLQRAAKLRGTKPLDLTVLQNRYKLK
jgi:hypothetical protein